MSRRKRAGDGSLELLLDTICNTFGGVLFVAILIVVVLRMTSKTEASSDTEPVSEAEMLQLEMRQADLAATLATLRRAAADIAQQLAPADDTVDLFNDLQKARNSRQELLESRMETLGRIADHQASINRTTRDLSELDARIEKAVEERKELTTTLKSEIDERSQRAGFSATRATGKTEVQTILRYGRFYVWHRYGPSGDRRGLNTDEFVVLDEDGTEIRTTPNPIAGTPADDATESMAQLRDRLKPFRPNRDYIAVLVWPDSFDSFQYLKKVLVDSGFEYRLIPAEQDDVFRDRGGSGKVQ